MPAPADDFDVRTTVSDTAEGAERRTPAAKRDQKSGVFSRVVRFVREVVDELKKVVRPTRDEVVNYTLTVLVFVAAIMAFVTVADYGIGKLTFFVFGS
jgi:preprotein translocase subunit SecE